MIDYFVGKVQTARDNYITMDIRGFGIKVQVPQATTIAQGKETKLFTYLHWNAENGPSLYGFQTQLSRQVFVMIIDCPKIGPSIGISILSHFTAHQFLDLITTQNEKQLSTVNGIGTKKAEQIIVQLKHKVQKLISSGTIVCDDQSSFTQWQNISDVLTSLNYSKQEISAAIQYLSKQYSNQDCSLEQLIRVALSHLSSTKQTPKL